jgi:scyllo-inositol 2-dehydrogenase (NADP+)
MPDAPALRVAVAGFCLAGGILHAPLIEATPGLELVAAVTRDPERRALLAQRHPQARAVDALEEVLGVVDLVVVATPNRLHVPQATAALQAGAHVVVDKPVAVQPEEIRALAQRAVQAGRLLIPFHNRRWDDDFLTLRRVAGEGALGSILRIESRFDRWRPELREGAWREEGDPVDGGGLLLDLGTHLVDQAIQLLGPVQAVYAELERRRPGAEVEDDVFLALHHPGGARSHLWAGVLAAHAAPRFRVLGDRGAFTSHGLDPQEAQLRDGARADDADFGRRGEDEPGAERHDGEHATPVAMEAGRWTTFYAGVVAAITAGGPVPVLAQEAVAVAEVLQAARKSTATGSVVELEQ